MVDKLRRSLERFVRVVGLALAALACSTSTSPPEVQLLGPVSTSAEWSIFVVAAREKERVTESLSAAGFRIVDNRLNAAYVLRATIGTDQSYSHCGAFHNVKYQLSAEDHPVLELKAKGWTGNCEENVLDALSEQLASALVDASRGAGR
jgi:hypothetical protein